MKTAFALRAIAPVFVAMAALVAVGCSDSTTKKDVANARTDLKEARQNTQETAREAQNDVANARQDAREHMVAKPVTPEQATDAQQDVAEARQ